MSGHVGNEGLWHFLTMLALQASVLSMVGLALGSIPRSAAHRHSVRLATILCLLGSPLLLAIAEWGGVVVPLPWLAPPAAAFKAAASPLSIVQHSAPSPKTRATEPPAESPADPAPLAPRWVTPPTPAHADAVTPKVSLRAEWVVAGVWGLCTILGLGGILRATWKTRLLLHDVQRVDPREHADVIDRARGRLGLDQYPPIGATGKVPGPSVVGLWRQSWVLMPLRFLETLTPTELLQVLVHEGAHVLRRDPMIVLLQRVTGAVYWWHPLVHLLNRRLDRAREEVCDNFVLQQERPEVYGATLLRLATLAPGMAPAYSPVGLLGGRWKLEDRIRDLLDPARPSTTRVRSFTAAGVWMGLALFSTLLAVTRLVAQTPESPSPETPLSETPLLETQPPTTQDPATATDDPAPGESPAPESQPSADEIEQAKLDYRADAKGAKRTEAAKLLYRSVRKGTPRGDVLTYFGAPDGSKAGLARFFNYTVDAGQEMEFEFDPNTELLIRKQETGLAIDPPPGEPAPIPDAWKPYLADYRTAKSTLRAGFTPPRTEFVWGEPLEITLRVENVGREDDEFTFGGDYRGSGRHNRIKVNVVDAQGAVLPDPRANAPDFGGILRREYLTPGGLKFEHTFNLADFRTIDKPGVYAVTCSFAMDDGQTEPAAAPRPTIESRFRLTILERTEKRVQKVIDRLVADAGTPQGLTWVDAMNRVARFGQADAVERLASLVAEGPLEQRIAATASLPLVPTETSESVALTALKDREPAIQVAAAGALGQFRTPRSEEALLANFIIDDSVVQEAILKALGAAQSARGLELIEGAILRGPPALKLSGLQALVAFNKPEAIAILQRLANSDDLLFRYQVLRALDQLRQPMEPDWVIPILMCRTLDHSGWYDVLRMIRMYCGDRAIPVLLSGLDFDVPWSSRNMWILSQVEACSGAPPCAYEYDPNSEGNAEQWDKNRETLARLKPLAGKLPDKIVKLPKSRPPYLKTQPPIDFETVIRPTENGAELTSGFYQLRMNRNGSTMSYTPTADHAHAYEVVQKVRSMLATPESLEKSGLNRDQVSQLGNLPPSHVQYDGFTSQKYSAWREAPPGPIQDDAAQSLGDAVRRASQDYHAAVVAYAKRAEEVLNAPPAQQQRPQAPEYGVDEIHPSQQDNAQWLALKTRLDQSPVKYRRVSVDEQGHCRLSLSVTPTTDLSHLRGMRIHELDLSHTGVTDLSPLRGMPLRVLDLSGAKVNSLAPLEGMPLVRLNISGSHASDLSPLKQAKLRELVATVTHVTDLAPLAEMPLEYLDIRRTRVRDLSPLAKAPLATLQLEDCPVKDLSPLRGVALEMLWLGGVGNEELTQLSGISAKTLVLIGKEITDVAPLKGLPLEALTLEQTAVESLRPLAGMPLKALSLRDTPVKDLTPLEGMPLESLELSEPGADLTPLKAMPLKTIAIPSVPTIVHLEILRQIPTLQWIRLPDCKPMPAAEFWKQVDAGAFGPP